DEVLLLTADGRLKGGVDAYLHVAGEVWWGKPLAWVGNLPWVKAGLEAAYRVVARNRMGITAACRLGAENAPVENRGARAGQPCHKGAFVADWVDALFVHFCVDAAELRKLVPAELELDLFEGDAYVSVVCFTQERLRPLIGGRLTEWLSRPLAHHA